MGHAAPGQRARRAVWPLWLGLGRRQLPLQTTAGSDRRPLHGRRAHEPREAGHDLPGQLCIARSPAAGHPVGQSRPRLGRTHHPGRLLRAIGQEGTAVRRRVGRRRDRLAGTRAPPGGRDRAAAPLLGTRTGDVRRKHLSLRECRCAAETGPDPSPDCPRGEPTAPDRPRHRGTRLAPRGPPRRRLADRRHPPRTSSGSAGTASASTRQKKIARAT
jgi:hypothetical protein